MSPCFPLQEPVNARSARQSLACVAIWENVTEYEVDQRFYTSGDFSEGTGRFSESSHNSQNKNNLRRNCVFYLNVQTPLMVFVMRREEGRKGKGPGTIIVLLIKS